MARPYEPRSEGKSFERSLARAYGARKTPSVYARQLVARIQPFTPMTDTNPKVVLVSIYGLCSNW